MIHYYIWGVVLLVAGLNGGLQGQTASGRLEVEIHGLRSEKGQLLIFCYNRSEGFPGDPAGVVASTTAKPQMGVTRVAFSGLKPGTYAVSLIHDENGDGKLDTNWAGIPREGYACSRNARGTLGPPKFSDASITVSAGQNLISVSLIYL